MPCPNLTEVARLGQLSLCCSQSGTFPSSRACSVLFPALRLSRAAVCAATKLSVRCCQDLSDLRTVSVLCPDRRGELVVTVTCVARWVDVKPILVKTVDKLGVDANGPSNDGYDILGECAGLVSADDGCVCHRSHDPRTGTGRSSLVMCLVANAGARVTMRGRLMFGISGERNFTSNLELPSGTVTTTLPK